MLHKGIATLLLNTNVLGLLSRGLNSGGGAVAGVHWAEAGLTNSEQLVNRRPSVVSVIGRSIMYLLL